MRTGKILKQQGSKLLILIFFLAIFDASAKGQSSETNKWSEYTQKKSVPAETGFGEETSADDVASELFSIMAEIAIEKARRDAADVLVGRIKNKLCAIEIKSDPPVKLQSRLTRTCRVLDSANYNNLDSLGKSLKDAFIEDVISNGKNVLIRELEKKFFGAKVQLKDLVRDFEKIKNELDNSKKEFDALITSMDALVSKLKELKTKILDPQEIDDVISSLGGLGGDITTLANAIDSLKEKLPEQVKKELKKMIKKLRSLKDLSSTSDEAKKEFKKLADLEKEITELVTLYYSIMLKGLTHKGQTSVGKNNRLMNYMAYFPWEEIFDSEKHKREIAYMELVFTSLRAYGNHSGRKNTIDLVKDLLEHIEQDKIETLKKYKSIIKKISPIELEKLVNIGAKTLGYEDLTQGERLQAASDFFLTILEMVLEKNDINFPVEDLESLKNIINSKLNNDNPRLVSELLKAAGRHIDRAAKNANDSKKSVKNLSSLMNALTIYTETYSNDDDKLKNIRAARKLVLENLMDEAADREGRYGENIWSLGINVGFNLGGYQGTWNGEHTGYTPQLSLPLGIYFQTMPGHDSYCGFHMGLFFFDLAQYANYHPTEGINQPAWNTAFTVGFQIGLIIGKPRYLFNIGLDVRYSPAIFFSKDSNTSSTNPGGLRAGIYAQYYVSFFDFN